MVRGVQLQQRRHIANGTECRLVVLTRARIPLPRRVVDMNLACRVLVKKETARESGNWVTPVCSARELETSGLRVEVVCESLIADLQKVVCQTRVKFPR